MDDIWGMALRSTLRESPRVYDSPMAHALAALPLPKSAPPPNAPAIDPLEFIRRNAPKPANSPLRFPGILGAGAAVAGIAETTYQLYQVRRQRIETEVAARELWRLTQVGIDRVGRSAEQVIWELAEMAALMRRAAELQFQIQQLKQLSGTEAEVHTLTEQLDTLQLQMHTAAKTYPLIGGALTMVATADGAAAGATLETPPSTDQPPTHDSIAAIFKKPPATGPWGMGWDYDKGFIVSGATHYPRLEALAAHLVAGKTSPRIVERGPGRYAALAIVLAQRYSVTVIEKLQDVRPNFDGLPAGIRDNIRLLDLKQAPTAPFADLTIWIHPIPQLMMDDDEILDLPFMGQDVVPGGYLVIQTERQYYGIHPDPDWELVHDAHHGGFLAPSRFVNYTSRTIVLRRK